MAKITVLQTNTKTGRDYCIVKVDDEDLGQLMLNNGLAKLVINSKKNEDYEEAEKEAKGNKIGIWSEEKNVKNITWDDGSASTELYNKYKNQQMTGLVELVLSGSSFRVLIGETVVLVHLTGVQCPSNKKDEDKKEKKKIITYQQLQKKQNILQNYNSYIEM